MVSFLIAADITTRLGGLIKASVFTAWHLRFLEVDPKSRVTLCGWPYIPPYNAIRLLWRFFVISFKWFKMGAEKCAQMIQQDHEGRPVRDKVKFLWTLSFYFSATIVAGYMFCMTYFVIEAFISIRSLPDGAYDMPPLTQILPHI